MCDRARAVGAASAKAATQIANPFVNIILYIIYTLSQCECKNRKWIWFYWQTEGVLSANMSVECWTWYVQRFDLSFSRLVICLLCSTFVRAFCACVFIKSIFKCVYVSVLVFFYCSFGSSFMCVIFILHIRLSYRPFHCCSVRFISLTRSLALSLFFIAFRSLDRLLWINLRCICLWFYNLLLITAYLVHAVTENSFLHVRTLCICVYQPSVYAEQIE